MLNIVYSCVGHCCLKGAGVGQCGSVSGLWAGPIRDEVGMGWAGRQGYKLGSECGLGG